MNDKEQKLYRKAKNIRKNNSLDADLQTVMLLLLFLEQKENLSSNEYEPVIVSLDAANNTIEELTVEEAGILAKEIPEKYLPDETR